MTTFHAPHRISCDLALSPEKTAAYLVAVAVAVVTVACGALGVGVRIVQVRGRLAVLLRRQLHNTNTRGKGVCTCEEGAYLSLVTSIQHFVAMWFVV